MGQGLFHVKHRAVRGCLPTTTRFYRSAAKGLQRLSRAVPIGEERLIPRWAGVFGVRSLSPTYLPRPPATTSAPACSTSSHKAR